MTISPPAVRVGAQVPRFLSRPSGLSHFSSGREAVELCGQVGMTLDPWQELALDVSLVESDEWDTPRWCAREVGLIVPRQNGKGTVLEARELAGLFLFGERLILHSAHEFKTAQEAFFRLKGWIDNVDWLRKRVARVRTSHGEEGIELLSGQRIRFVARSTGSGRGFTGDVIVLDEAYALTDVHMSALIPTLSARSAKDNPQIWYTSSAPLDGSMVLHRIRRRGRRGDPAMAFLEWSCPDDADLDDVDNAYAANPGLGIRISEEFVMTTERAAMASRDWARERLGVAPEPPETGHESVWPPGAWDAACGASVAPDVGVVLGVDVHPDRVSAAIGAADVAGRVELVEHRAGVGWVVDRAVEIARRQSARIALQGNSPAGALVADLERAGVEVIALPAAEVRDGCGQFYDAVAARTSFIRRNAALDAAAAAATKRTSGDGWVFDRRHGSDITPIYAVVLARKAATRPDQTETFFAY